MEKDVYLGLWRFKKNAIVNRKKLEILREEKPQPKKTLK